MRLSYFVPSGAVGFQSRPKVCFDVQRTVGPKQGPGWTHVSPFLFFCSAVPPPLVFSTSTTTKQLWLLTRFQCAAPSALLLNFRRTFPPIEDRLSSRSWLQLLVFQIQQALCDHDSTFGSQNPFSVILAQVRRIRLHQGMGSGPSNLRLVTAGESDTEEDDQLLLSLRSRLQ